MSSNSYVNLKIATCLVRYADDRLIDQRFLRDRVRTVGALHALLQRTSCANNGGQFARWFDEKMRRLHPGRTWETSDSNKWQKNLTGTVAMTNASVDLLQELFPDSRFYSTTGHTGPGRRTEVAYPDDSQQLLNEPGSARQLFEVGPGRLWAAIWTEAERIEGLWDIYPAGDTRWGTHVSFDDALGDLEMKLYSNFDCNVPISLEDLGRAIVLYRVHDMNSTLLGYQGCDPMEWGVRTFLCLRLALAAAPVDAFGIFRDVSDFFAGMEVDRLDRDERYRRAVECVWAQGQCCSAGELMEYAVNPFLRLAASSAVERWTTRYWTLAALTNAADRRCGKTGE
ncbi:hypothetical protein [Burkholderia cenocepacia]|uniref:hypothetical protein n=3 Tax=Burkholderia cenocepacia TaxID=95486 RepID=UPI00117840B1|nr:hypothetical protein [Burkholderia cenocepacia]